MPLISVIVPVYKVEQYLHRCVDSILCQSFSDFELILVDDGSPDNCSGICDEYAQKDSRVSVIHQKNGGLSAARNAGIDWAFKHSNSQWLFFVDSDDFIHPESLGILLEAALEHDTKISIGGFAETTGNLPWVQASQRKFQVWESRQLFKEKNLVSIVAWGKLYAKDLFLKIRYPVGRIHEDEFVTYKLLFSCNQVSFVDAPLYGYYYNPDGITKKEWYPKRADVLDAYRERLAFFRKIKDYELEDSTRENYVWAIKYHLNQSKKHPRIHRKLRRRLGKTLIRYCRKYPFREYLWLYTIAFPPLTLVLNAKK